jgi:hypothetical protein
MKNTFSSVTMVEGRVAFAVCNPENFLQKIVSLFHSAKNMALSLLFLLFLFFSM